MNPIPEKAHAWPERAPLPAYGLLVLLGLPLYVLCQLHLSGDIFAWRGGGGFPQLAFSGRLLAGVSAYGGLLLVPLLGRVLRRQVARGCAIGCLAAVAAGSVLMAFPWLFVDFAAPLPPIRLLVEHCLRDGLTAPLGFLSVVLGLSAAVGRLNWRVCILLSTAFFVGALLLQPLWRGPAFPRLEDEVAYHLQALIFRSGHFFGQLALPESAQTAQPAALMPITWVDFSGHKFWSAHFHGWSAVLALLASAGLEGYAGSFCALLSLLLFFLLARRLLPGERSMAFAASLGLFASVRLVSAQAHTYMSHSMALALALGCCLAWVSLDSQGTDRSLRWRVAAAGSLAFCCAAYALTRAQSLAALLCAFILADLIPSRGSGEMLRDRVPRIAVVLGAGLGAWAVSVGYRFLSQTTYVASACQSLGFGPGHGCFPTYGTMGHSFTKTVLNGMDILGRWNQEAAPGGLPFLLVVIPLLLPGFFRIGRSFRMLLLLGAGHSLLFALYFHYGGESYRGRYLTEVSFVLPLLAGAVLHRAREAGPAARETTPGPFHSDLLLRLLPIAVAVSLVSAIVLNPRIDYFNPYLEAVRSLPVPGRERQGPALLVAPHHPGVAPAQGKSYPDEFSAGSVVHFQMEQFPRFINTGPGTLVATAKSLGPDGFPRDGAGNVLIGPIDEKEVTAWLRHFGLKRAYRLRYRSARPLRKTRHGWTLWEPAAIDLEPMALPGKRPFQAR